MVYNFIIALVNVVSGRMYSGDSAVQSIYHNHIQKTPFIHPRCGLKINQRIISVASSLIYSELWWSVYVINYDLLNNDEQRIIRNFIITIRNANLFLTIQEFLTNCNPWKLHACPHHSTALGIKSSSDHWQWIWICKIDTINLSITMKCDKKLRELPTYIFIFYDVWLSSRQTPVTSNVRIFNYSHAC